VYRRVRDQQKIALPTTRWRITLKPFVFLALLVWLVPVALSAQPVTQPDPPISRCKPRYPTPEMQAAMYDLAAITADTLDDLPENVKVLIAARSGQDLSRYGLRHSHLAFFLYDEKNDRWQVIHLLNRCKSATSALYREGLVNFIGETAAQPAGLRLGIPTPPLQQAIVQLLTEPAQQVRALHQSRYNAIAYPWGTDYQNSNQWVLEVTAAAMAQVADGSVLNDRHASIAWLKEHGYTPSRLHIDFIRRWGTRFFVKNATIRDHPRHERHGGNFLVVTVESIFDFLQQNDALEKEISLILPQVIAEER